MKTLPIIPLLFAVHVITAQSHISLQNNLLPSNPLNDNYKTQVMQYRLLNFIVEDYDAGIYVKSDSMYYVYDTEQNYGHGNFDFIEVTNYSNEPLFYLSELLVYTDGAWEGSYKYYNNFDADDMRTSTNIDSWDGDTYAGDSRVEYSYNDDNAVDTVLFLAYAPGDYDSIYRYVYTYSDGVLANIVYQSYGSEWVNDLLLIYTFTPEGLIDNIVYRDWDGVGWYDEGRYLFSYDLDGNITEKLGQAYEFGWQTTGRYVYSYDGTGFNNNVEIQSYDGVEYTSSQQFALTEFADGLPSTNYVSFWDGFIWDPAFRFTFRYESFDDGTIGIENENPTAQFDLYPNPTTDNLTISFMSNGQYHSSLVISDASGKIVDRQTFVAVQGMNRIQNNIAATLPAGIYNASLMIGGTRVVKSFVVE